MIDHKIDPGQLDRRVGVRSPTDTTDDTGGVTTSYTTVATVWAKIEYPATGQREELMAAKETIGRRVLVTIRYYLGINEMYSLLIDSEDYDIISIAEIGRKEFQEIEAELRK